MAGGPPMELIDSFKWEKRSKIITRDVHGVSGLMNLTHFSHLTAEPSTPMHFHSGILEMHCIVKGRSMARLLQEGRTRTVSYTGGEALVVFPGEYHARGSEERQDPCELYALQLNLEEAGDFLGLNPARGQTFADGTLGGGGHSEAILSRMGEGTLYGIDRDEAAVKASQAQKEMERQAAAHGCPGSRFQEISRREGSAAAQARGTDRFARCARIHPEQGFVPCSGAE